MEVLSGAFGSYGQLAFIGLHGNLIFNVAESFKGPNRAGQTKSKRERVKEREGRRVYRVGVSVGGTELPTVFAA